MNSQTNLLNIFENENQPLVKRLKVAQCKFTGIDTHIVKNQEIILNWLKRKSLDKSSDLAERKLVLATLKYCITAVIDVILNPQLADTILEVLLQIDLCEPESAECFEEALRNEHFLKYFVNRLQKFVEFVITCAQRTQRTELTKFVEVYDRSKVYEAIICSILFLKRLSFQLDELRLILVQSLTELISELALEMKKANTPNFLLFKQAFYQLLFSDVNYRKSLLSNVLSTNSDSSVFDIIAAIRNYPTQMKPDVLTSAYSLIFGGILQSNATPNAKFRVFVALNSFIYIRPVALGEENPKCVMFKENVQTSNRLLELLWSHDISVDSVTQSISLMDWLKALIDAVLGEIKNNLTCPVIMMLKNTLSFTPSLIENCLRKFTKNVMLLKKSDPFVVEKYSELCSHVLGVHVRLNRMHKLISALLISVKENLDEFRLENLPSKFDVLPEQIFDKIQSAVQYLPSTVQNVALLNVLLYHLENDCIVVFEKQDSKEIDTKSVLLFDIVSYLISRFVSGTRIMDFSVPDVVKEKFISLMDNLGALLGRFGKVIISKKHSPELVECFLHLCTVWGNMQIVFMTYESSSRKVTKQIGTTGSAATNLVYLHPYLSDYHWNLIAQRVANFGNENCVRQLNDLVLQKIHALSFIEDETEGPFLEGDGPAAVCALYLMNQPDVKWTFAHIQEYVHLLKPENILNVSKNLVNYCETCHEDEVSRIFAANFQETRPLVLGMTSYIFHNMSRNLRKQNLKELSRALRRLDYVEMMEVEMEEEDGVSLKTKLDKIGKLVSSDFKIIEDVDDLNTNAMERIVNLLLYLPAQYLRKENKTMVCLLTLCSMKCLIQLREHDNVKRVLENLAKFLQSILTDVWLPDSLDCGKILIWFYWGLRNMSCCEWTMRKLCEAQRNYDSEVDRVVEIVKTAVGGQSPPDVFIQSCNEGIDFVTSYLINFRKARKRKSDDSGHEVVKKLKILCYENFDEIFDSIRIECKQLALYTLLLREALESEDTERVQQLLPHLPKFLSFMEDNIDSNSSEISQFLLVVLRHIKQLRSRLPDNFMVNAWEYRWYISEDEVNKTLLRISSFEEYEEIIHSLLAHTEGSLNNFDESELPVLSRAWKFVLSTSVKLKKMRVKKRAVSEFCALAQKYTILDENDEHRNSLNRIIVQVLTAVLQNTEMSLRYQTVDLCFDLISSAVGANPSDVLLIECVEMLFVFCLIWRSMLLDRIPAFYLCYKSLFALTVRRAESTKCENIEALSCVVHKLEKLTDNLVRSRKDFTKTAISAVSDLLNVVIEVKIENRLESHFKNIIYCWIGMCDSHGLQFLSTATSPVVQNQLKQYQSEYKKYYKFTGKV